MKKLKIYIIFLGLILFLIFVFLIFNFSEKKINIIGNKEVMKEIDRLVLPITLENISVNDFDKLKNQVKGDLYASSEVNELIILTKYKEYAHIGHGIVFLYEYVKTGEEPICPGHLLAHYYVFMNHSEYNLAMDNLNEVKIKLNLWNAFEDKQNASYILENNITYYKETFRNTLNEISNGNKIANDDKISLLANAPCAK